MITDPITIPLEGEQASVFQGWDAQEQAANVAIAAAKAARNGAATAIIAAKMPLADIQGCRIEIVDAGILIIPPAPKSDPLPSVPALVTE